MNRTLINSIIFIFLFISPHIIYSVIPVNFVAVYYTTLPICYVLIVLWFTGYLKEKIFFKPLLLSVSFLIFGIINLILHGSTAFFNLIAPIASFLGYCFVFKKKIDLRVFDFFLVTMYIFFYFVYFSVIPDLFYRPGFDEDAFVFDNSSSNAIPMALNITLYAYTIMNRFYVEGNNKKILIFSLINLILAIIQQSRVGLLISLVMFFLSLFNYDKKKMLRVLAVSFILFFVAIVMYYDVIVEYIEGIGKMNGIEALNEDIRGEAQRSFFNNMDLAKFFFGFEENYIYAVGTDGKILYTYNVFLDMWNKYGLFQLILFIGVLFFRVFNHSKFHFPLYFFIPFLLYSMVESIFFPNFWDCIVYILLFTPKRGLPYFINDKVKESAPFELN
nr:hypothetical protein [uncultured Flavobacterium sp.]